MALVVDTNIILAAILGEPEKTVIEKLTMGEELAAPAVLPYEIGNAFSRMAMRSRLKIEQIEAAIDIYMAIPIRLVETNLQSVLQIASEYKIYAYDAYYIEIAKRLRCRLFTLDKKMKQVAAQVGVQVLEV
jgi:predicted nucleic acid-binding protein